MNILINRTDAIGDTLLSIPLGLLIKLKFPQAKIGFIVSPRSYDLIQLVEGIDSLYLLDPKDKHKNKWQKYGEIFEDFCPDQYFHLGGDFTPTAFSFFKRIPFRGGLVSKIPSFLFLNRGLRQSRSQVEKHESVYNMDLAKPLGIDIDDSLLDKFKNELSPRFQLHRDQVDSIVSELPLEGKRPLLIHPGMSGHTLNWPNEDYGELANRLNDKYAKDYKIVVSFTPGDLAYVEGMKSAMNEQTLRNTYFLDGSKKGLIHYTHVLAGAALFIGPSTGTTHMANALRVKQVALYSPIKVQSEKRWGPFYRDERVRVFCPTENSFKKWGEDKCMATVSIDDVFEACEELLRIPE